MANTYYTLLTTIGQASIANAIALNQTVSLTHMAVGDGNGVPTVPKESQTELVNEVYRAQINQLTTDLDNPNYLIAEMIVPTNIGGWSVREVGLFDENENLIAIAKFPETYKPKLEEGSGRDLVIRIILQVSNTDVVTLKVDPTVILASQAWVIDNFSKSKLFPGGAKDQVLTKLSDTAGDMGWKYPSGVPIGTVEYFAMATPPAGYLKADGAAVGRDTYPDLFAAIGTAYGEGDGEITFNLPDMIGRFSEGSLTPGKCIEAGLPNVDGSITNGSVTGILSGNAVAKGAFAIGKMPMANILTGSGVESGYSIEFNAKQSSAIYGNSDTVQPPALTLLPCIKAFDAAVNPGLIDVTELAQEIAGKVDRVINGKNIAYIVDSYNDMKGNWWREWSDGWLEQGGLNRGNGIYTKVTINLLRPFSGPDYTLVTGSTIGGDAWYTNNSLTSFQAATSDLAGCFTDKTINSFNIQGFSDHLWCACGVKG